VHEDDSHFGFEVDHIVSEKHGGSTREDNLAYACLFCNRSKGSNIASFSPETGTLTRLFHPRRDRWADHFRLGEDGYTIEPITDIGQVTEHVFGFNRRDRLMERQALMVTGRYPVAAAWQRIREALPPPEPPS
jgi:hypothetical protein